MTRLLFVGLSLLFYISLHSQTASPAVEVRAVWLTTNWNLDWPMANHSVEQQKKHLRDILDEFQRLNINTLFFQSRIRGDVFYKSRIEPLSPYAKKDFDYLQFVTEECHKRGIECHAWIVTFPVGSNKQVRQHGKNSIVNKRRDLCEFYNNEWYLDPGNPGSKEYILTIVEEIVRNYDIDGIHFDYIRYPEKALRFPDSDTYRKYGKGLSLADWRRDNISKLVDEVYNLVKSLKPWVQVSSSPIGKYRDLGINGSGWTAFSSVYQDAVFWLQSGIHDALYPMLYYKESDFYPYLDDWARLCNERLIVPGLGLYQMLPSEKNWILQDVTKQLEYTRDKGISGQAYFRGESILKNTKGIKDYIKSFYPYPAKLPAMKWLDNVAPNSPVDFSVYRNAEGKLSLSWIPYNDNESQTYTIYCSSVEDVDTNNPQNILATGIRDNSMELDIKSGDFGFYYSVSASDRFHNESVPCFPAYFVHSEYEK